MEECPYKEDKYKSWADDINDPIRIDTSKGLAHPWIQGVANNLIQELTSGDNLKRKTDAIQNLKAV